MAAESTQGAPLTAILMDSQSLAVLSIHHWACYSAGSKRPIAEWEIYRVSRGFKSLLKPLDLSPPLAEDSALLSGVAAPVTEPGE